MESFQRQQTQLHNSLRSLSEILQEKYYLLLCLQNLLSGLLKKIFQLSYNPMTMTIQTMGFLQPTDLYGNVKLLLQAVHVLNFSLQLEK